MKIVHTSDWHIGRRWKGIQRLDELEAVLDHLAAFIEEHAIDLVLHTGDVFESRNPPAEAEQLVNRFLVRVGRTGAQMVVIAGNHDDPLRLDARSLLTESRQRTDPRPPAPRLPGRGPDRRDPRWREGGRRGAAVRIPWSLGIGAGPRRRGGERPEPICPDVRARRPGSQRRLSAGRRQPPHGAYAHRGRRLRRIGAPRSHRGGLGRLAEGTALQGELHRSRTHPQAAEDRCAGARLLCRIAPPDGLRRGRGGKNLYRRHGVARQARPSRRYRAGSLPGGAAARRPAGLARGARGDRGPASHGLAARDGPPDREGSRSQSKGSRTAPQRARRARRAPRGRGARRISGWRPEFRRCGTTPPTISASTSRRRTWPSWIRFRISTTRPSGRIERCVPSISPSRVSRASGRSRRSTSARSSSSPSRGRRAPASRPCWTRSSSRSMERSPGSTPTTGPR